MVNAQKHKALLNDTETRVHKRLNKLLCLSNNAKKKDINDDKYLLANGGNCGVNEIHRTNIKRNNLERRVLNGFN